jgi:ubiquinone/menaquinone biosynthesis C-methylase UbiE
MNPAFAHITCAGDVNRLPLATSSIDVALANNLLEHVNTPHVCLAEIHRVLKPEGTLHVLVPFLTAIHQQPIDFFRYTEFGLRSLARDAGFVERHFERVGGVFLMQGHVLPALMGRLFERLESKRGGRIPARILLSCWKEFYYRLLLPTLYRLDATDTHEDFAIGYLAVFEKPEQTP